MSFMRKKEETTITTPIPSTLSLESVLATLHDHTFLINLSPAIESSSLTSGVPSSKASYSITDKKPIGRTTYELTISPCAEGVDTEVTAHPPPGLLKIESKWRVARDAKGDWVLVEEVKIEANRIMVGKVKENIQVTHKEQHGRLFEEAAKRA